MGMGDMDMSKMSQEMIDQMVASVTALPNDQRKTMMKDRMTMIMEMPDEKMKMQALKMMNRALHKLSDQDLMKMLRTRLDLLYEMSQMMREKALMSIEANKAILMQIPEKDMMREAGIMKKLIQELPTDRRTVIESMMREAKCTACLVNP